MTRRSGSGLRRGSSLFIVLGLAPALILYFLFMLMPTFEVFRMSLFERIGVTGSETFTGLDNFGYLIDDPQFIRAFQNTIFLLVVVSIVTLAGGLALAGVMTQGSLKLRNFYRFVLYLPSVLSIVVIAAIFAAIYDQENGLLNGSLFSLGLDGLTRVWLGDPDVILFSIAFAMVWQSLGYYLVLYMAGMTSIPSEVYEASALDGATSFRQFFEITLPLVWETIRTSLTFFIISSVNLSFVLVRALTNGGPSGSSETLLGYMYKQAYTNSAYGYGMAIGTVIFLFSFATAAIISRTTKREVLQF